MLVWLVEELDGWIAAGSPMGFLECSGKTFCTIFHSCLILVMSFCRLAWKEKVVKVIEAVTDQGVGGSVGGSKDLNSLQTGSLQW